MIEIKIMKLKFYEPLSSLLHIGFNPMMLVNVLKIWRVFVNTFCPTLSKGPYQHKSCDVVCRSLCIEENLKY